METDLQDNTVESAINIRTANDPAGKVAFEGDYRAVEVISPDSLRELDMIRANMTRVLRMVEILHQKVQRKVAQEQAEPNKEMSFVRIEDEKPKVPKAMKLFANFSKYFGPDEDIKDDENVEHWKNKHIFD